MTRHEKIPCDICGKMCGGKNGLKLHKEAIHPSMQVQAMRAEEKAKAGAEENPLPTIPEPDPPDVVDDSQQEPESSMFDIDYAELDSFGLPTHLYTKSRLIDMPQAYQQAKIDTRFILYNMQRSIFGKPCALLIPSEQVELGRPMSGFGGNPVKKVEIGGVDYFRVSRLIYPHILKMRFLLHTMPTEMGKPRWEEIQTKAITVTPEGIPTAPPAIMYPNSYSAKKGHDLKKTFAEVAKGEEQ